LPRSSIIVSDEPLSSETNYRTEFVAVLADQPQGGFITRKPTEVRVARRSTRDDDGGFFNSRRDGGFGFGFRRDRDEDAQPANTRRRGGQANERQDGQYRDRQVYERQGGQYDDRRPRGLW
jgi:hypothetical protein